LRDFLRAAAAPAAGLLGMDSRESASTWREDCEDERLSSGRVASELRRGVCAASEWRPSPFLTHSLSLSFPPHLGRLQRGKHLLE
jgi:hypothetical protein